VSTHLLAGKEQVAWVLYNANMKRRRFMILLWFTFCILVGTVVGVVMTTTEYPTLPGVFSTWLPARCRLITFDNPALQPDYTITVGCPGVDTIRLWPLPIVHPWFEDWFEPYDLQDPANLKT
jgi:hypothetical protein